VNDVTFFFYYNIIQYRRHDWRCWRHNRILSVRPQFYLNKHCSWKRIYVTRFPPPEIFRKLMEFSDIKVNVLGFTSEHNKCTLSFSFTWFHIIKSYAEQFGDPPCEMLVLSRRYLSDVLKLWYISNLNFW